MMGPSGSIVADAYQENLPVNLSSKPIIKLALVAGAVLSLAACASHPKPAPTPAAPPPPPPAEAPPPPPPAAAAGQRAADRPDPRFGAGLHHQRRRAGLFRL